MQTLSTRLQDTFYHPRNPSHVGAPRRACTPRAQAPSSPSTPPPPAQQQQRNAPYPYTTATQLPPADPATRRYTSFLPPFFSRPTVLETYDDGLWGLVQPLDLSALGLVDIGLRAVVARLGDGSLLIHNPVAPTAETLSLLTSLGAPVKHILISSNSPEHWLYAPALLDKFPDAQLWVTPGLFDPVLSKVLGPLGLNSLRGVAQELVAGQGALSNEVQLVPFKTPLTLETGVVLLKYRALLVSDAAIYLDVPSANTLVKEGAEAAGIWQRMGPITPQLFEQYPKEGAAFVDQVGECPFDIVIPGHGQAPVPDGKLAWQRCFAFVDAA